MCLNQVKKLEMTLAIFKPHVTANPFAVKAIREKIKDNGFLIIKYEKRRILLAEAQKFYDEHRGKFYFNRLITFMCSGPCTLLVLARENAIKTWREMMGPTKVFKTLYSDPDTIRGLYGLSDTRNATHGSDSPESAEREIKILFPEFRLKDWYENEEKKFLTGEYTFDSRKCTHTANVLKQVSDFVHFMY